MKKFRQRLVVMEIIVFSLFAPFIAKAKAPDYKNPLLPIEQRVQDLLSRMTLKEKVGQMNIPTCYSTELGHGLGYKGGCLWDDPSKANRDKQLDGCRKWAEGTHNNVFGPGCGFFTLSDRLIYEGTKRQAEVMLLKNDNNILPLKKDIKSIAVIGPNADEPIYQLGDYLPHHVPQEVVTVLKGIKNKVRQ